MFDDLVADKPATFQWLLHAYDKIRIDEGSRELRIANRPAAMKVELLLPEKMHVSGTVLDVDGGPASDISLTMYTGMGTGRGRSGADGRFTIEADQMLERLGNSSTRVVAELPDKDDRYGASDSFSRRDCEYGNRRGNA